MLRVDHHDKPAAPLTNPAAAPARAPAAAPSFDRAAARDERAAGASRPPRGGAPATGERPRARARTARPGASGGIDDGGEGTGAAGPWPAPLLAAAPWLRPEGALRPPGAGHHQRLDAPLPPLAAPGDRVLIGVGAHRGEARVCIGHGPLAGAEIHLRHGPAGIHAVVLTALQSSRKTLSVAMLEVARRLARRGQYFHAAGCDEGDDHRAAAARADLAPGTRGG